MAEDDQSDPFLWDEDRVVQELCTSNRSWNAPPTRRLPDPAALEASLRDCGVDGESLLTFEDEFGFDKLWGYLGVKKLPHQLSLKEAVTQFRKRSPKYREWKAQHLGDSQECHEDSDGWAIKSEPHKPVGFTNVQDVAPAQTPTLDNDDAEPRAAPPHFTDSFQGVLSPALSLSADRDLPAPSEVPQVLNPSQDAVDEPPKKKRRMAPTTISAEPTGNAAFANIPTEGDMFLMGAPETMLQADNGFGYLGTGALPLRHLTDPQSGDLVDANKVFAWVQQQLPPGRRIQVSAAMKRFLRSDRAGRISPDRRTPEDPELPMFGDPDDDVSLDSDTWREYEQEEAERAAREAREKSGKERLLSRDEVTDLVHTAIEELESRWVAEKKPKCDLKAWRLWQDARRNPDRLAFITSVKRELAHLEGRIARYSKHIINEPWQVGNNVRQKASEFLEVSVFERQHRAWFIDLLESPRQPPKPSTLPRPKLKRAKPQLLDEDEEELTSESDMDAFIDYDDDVPLVGDEMEIDSQPPSEQVAGRLDPCPDITSDLGDEADQPGLPTRPSTAPLRSPGERAGNDLAPAQTTPKKIKAEQSLDAATPRQAGTAPPEVIEIDSSPPSFNQLTPHEVPGMGDLESLEKIGEIGADYWEDVSDAKRLVIALLYDWSREKRLKIDAAIRNHHHTELWANYVSPILDDPTSITPDSVGFLLCRLFDAFISKTAKRARFSTIRDVTRGRIRRDGDLFAGFCAFLGRIVPIFLGTAPHTPTQRSRRQETPDMRDPAEDEESTSDDALAPSTKKRRRRRLHDKEAANLRADTLKLNEELERRRRQLREKMAQQGSVSGRQSRLIVNETKESDDQALIYVNDHIGNRIKDHQIEGVRFMWNQVVVDSAVRQGCLLAHTMGLGKTMQVITLLVVVAESSASPDESVRSQIPEDLRESKTLILCPPSLVDNWQEEIRMWAPDNVLGPVWRLDPTMSLARRIETIRTWASSAGVFIVGYTMFTKLVQDSEQAAELLRETPTLVVADEAHYMKNPESQRHQATANFKTMNRIAMTGSPLTNDVMDYYAMINWVAPNYLADIAEFRQKYANPIREGLYADSEPYQKRKARKLLHVLKATVDPKVHRRDIEVLVSELPKKKEFIISLPLTKVQRRLYETYIEWMKGMGKEAMQGQAKAWSLVAKLGLVLAHPFIFRTVAEAQKKAQSSKSAKPPTGEESDEDGVELPQNVLSQLLAAVAMREISDYALSNKILVLLQILDECRKVGDKVLVFSQRSPTLDYIETIFKRQRVVYQRLDGQTPMATRQDSVKKFNTGSQSEVYLVSTKAGGVGLNIHGANRVVIFDFKFSPTDEQQAIGRAYRLGQTKPVYVYYLTVGGTFEDIIHNIAVFKTQLASRVVDKKNPDPWSTRFAPYFAMPKELEQADLSGAYNQDKVLDALLKSARVGGLIRKITSTETFEREEKYELTAEEKQEAEQDIELERLRSQNPEEFRRREQERASRAILAMPSSLPPLGSNPPRFANGESPTAPQPTGSPSNRVVIIKVPEHLRDKRKPAPQAPMMVSGAAPAQHAPLHLQPNSDHPEQQILTLTSDAALVSPSDPFTLRPTNPTVPASTQPLHAQGQPTPSLHLLPQIRNALNNALATIQEPKAPGPQPILASGTHFKPPEVPSSSERPSGPTTPAEEAPEAAFPELMAVHSALCHEGRHVRYHPRDLINKVNGVLARNKVEKLPKMDKIQNLKKCSRNPRFAEAMLAGYVEPEQLASFTRLEMEQISASLNSMAETEFRQRVWTSKADLSHVRTQSSTNARTTERRSTGGGAGGGVGPGGLGDGKGGAAAARGVLRFIGSGPEPQGPSPPVTPQDRRRAVKPGDSAESPQVID